MPLDWQSEGADEPLDWPGDKAVDKPVEPLDWPGDGDVERTERLDWPGSWAAVGLARRLVPPLDWPGGRGGGGLAR